MYLRIRFVPAIPISITMHFYDVSFVHKFFSSEYSMSTAQLYIFEVLRQYGLQCPERRIDSIYQIFMLHQIYKFASLYRNQFSSKDFDVGRASGHVSLRRIFDNIFVDGVNLGRVVAMYAYGGWIAVEYLKCNFPEICYHIPVWIDDYICTHLKPRLILQDRWQCYKKLFHLL